MALFMEPRGERGRRVEPRTVPVVETPDFRANRPVSRLARAGQHSGVFANALGTSAQPVPGARELRREPRHRREGARSLVVGQDDDHVGSVVGAFAWLRSEDRRAEPGQRDEGRPGHPTAGRRGTHPFRTFQMCSAGNARAPPRDA